MNTATGPLGQGLANAVGSLAGDTGTAGTYIGGAV
ncbi:hypothetical protein ACLBOM_12490 [Escherichia coli]